MAVNDSGIKSMEGVGTRACFRIHSRDQHAPLRGIFGSNSVDVARYAAFI